MKIRLSDLFNAWFLLTLSRLFAVLDPFLKVHTRLRAMLLGETPEPILLCFVFLDSSSGLGVSRYRFTLKWFEYLHIVWSIAATPALYLSGSIPSIGVAWRLAQSCQDCARRRESRAIRPFDHELQRRFWPGTPYENLRPSLHHPALEERSRRNTRSPFIRTLLRLIAWQALRSIKGPMLLSGLSIHHTSPRRQSIEANNNGWRRCCQLWW